MGQVYLVDFGSVQAAASEGGRIEVKPQINIWAGTKKFRIGGGGLLSEIELDWLANELSDWLALPIIQEK